MYADVSDVPPVALAWERIVADRGNIRWMALVRLARLILGDNFQNSAHGDSEGFALLFDMNALFETFVEKLLGPLASAAGWRMKAQGGGLSCLHPEDGADPLFATYPDIQLLGGGRVSRIVDTKWKRLVDRSRDPKMEVRQADVYQMMAYAQLYECDDVVLLYPYHAGLVSSDAVVHSVASARGRVRLTVATVDLTSLHSARLGLLSLL